MAYKTCSVCGGDISIEATYIHADPGPLGGKPTGHHHPGCHPTCLFCVADRRGSGGTAAVHEARVEAAEELGVPLVRGVGDLDAPVEEREKIAHAMEEEIERQHTEAQEAEDSGIRELGSLADLPEPLHLQETVSSDEVDVPDFVPDDLENDAQRLVNAIDALKTIAKVHHKHAATTRCAICMVEDWPCRTRQTADLILKGRF